MKKVLMLILMAAMIVSAVSAQSADSETSAAADKPNLILTVPNFFSNYEYQNPDGQFLKIKEIKPCLMQVSENEPLIRKYNTLSITSYTLIGIFLAGCVVDMVYDFNDNLPYRETVMQANRYVSLGALLGAVIAGNSAKLKFQRAIDNYNIAVMSAQ